MKVREYVRTKNGEIGKLINVEVYYVLGQDDKDKYSCVLFNNSYVPCIVSNDFIVKKGQLIDLIEVGDYVNGELIIALRKDIKSKSSIHFNSKDNLIFTDYDIANNWYYGIDTENIKSIVTKEQFSQMEYRIEE